MRIKTACSRTHNSRGSTNSNFNELSFPTHKSLSHTHVHSLVQLRGGYDAVENNTEWMKIMHEQMKIPKNTSGAHRVKILTYRRYLLPFEEFLMSFTKSRFIDLRSRHQKSFQPASAVADVEGSGGSMAFKAIIKQEPVTPVAKYRLDNQVVIRSGGALYHAKIIEIRSRGL